MKFYRISEKDLIKLINSGRNSMKEELTGYGIDIEKDAPNFEIELPFDGQYSLELEDCMREDGIEPEIID